LDCGLISLKFDGFFAKWPGKARSGPPGQSDGREKLAMWPASLLAELAANPRQIFAGHKKQQNQEKPSRPGLQRQKLPSANQSEKIDGLQPYGYCASMEPTQATNVQHQLHNPAVYM